jgi:diacylglycerol kinase
VIALELINSAIENIADFVSPKQDTKIKKIKDLSAGAVLFSAIISVIIGLIVFLPKIVAVCLKS